LPHDARGRPESFVGDSACGSACDAGVDERVRSCAFIRVKGERDANDLALEYGPVL